MMRWVRLITLVCVAAGSLGGARDDERALPGTISRAAATQDLRDWFARVARVHPLGSETIHRRLADAVDRTIARLPPRLSPLEFFVLVAPLAASLNDSHTSIVAPGSAGVALPKLIVQDDAVILHEDVPPLRAGERIDAISGHSVERLLSVASPWASAENAAGAQISVTSLLPTALSVVGIDSPARLRVGSRVVDYKPSRLDKPLPAIEVRSLSNNIVVVTIRTFAGPIRFYEQWFDRLFAELDRTRARGLIVDLRENNGGSTTAGTLLLSYVTDRPFRLFGEKLWRVSREMQTHLSQNGTKGFAYYLALSPGQWTSSEPPIQAPPAPATRFAGPTVFLIGPRTRSAAMMLANAVEDFDLALLVGRPPASPPRYFGEVYPYRMQNTGLNAFISSAAFVRASGDEANALRVQPHISTDVSNRGARGSGLAVALAAIRRFHQTSSKRDRR